MEHLHIAGIPGSLRKNAFSTSLLRAAVELAPPDTEIEILDISGFPVFNQDQEAAPPPAVVAFKERVRAADAVLFSINEHNYSLSAAEKNAIDWASRPTGSNAWDRKPAGLMSASIGTMGGVRAQLDLRHAMVFLNMFPINKPEVIVPFANQKIDASGRVTDEAVRTTIAAHLVELVRHTRILVRGRAP
ncbi:MAG TPA: NAD(P)H-dependent oxidoreductase [Thermoplasmata archaeon]|nr:NAD(P)H-dependent oxidoreductase [Thermoplasmata archaeon]